jgi:hypothetical protein
MQEIARPRSQSPDTVRWAVGLELAPVFGWLAVAAQVAARSLGGWWNRDLPIVLDVVVGICVSILVMLDLTVFVISVVAIMLAGGIGWLCTGRALAGLSVWAGRSCLTWMAVFVTADDRLDDYFGIGGLSLFGLLAVSSVLSAAVLWFVETSQLRSSSSRI